MRVVVCVKHVPDTNEPKRYHPETKTLVREGVQSIINPMDDYALEQVLQWKDAQSDLEVVVLTMGPESAKDTIKKALAKGADRAVLVSDPALAGSDFAVVARVLSSAIQKIGDVDLVVAGVRSSDADTYQTGPAIAELLAWPQATLGKAAQLNVAERYVQVEREVEGAVEMVRATLPALVTMGKITTEPRLPSFKGIMAANKKDIQTWTVADLGFTPDQVGQAGSKTHVVRVFEPEARPASQTFKGSPTEVTKQLVGFLASEKLI